jgi:hypothetical protein
MTLMFSARASYLGSHELKSRPGDRLSFPGLLLGFSQSLQEDSERVQKNWAQPLPSLPFLIQFAIIIESFFDTIM